MAWTSDRERRHPHARRNLGRNGHELRLSADLFEQGCDLTRCVRVVEGGAQFDRSLEVSQVLSELSAKLFVEHSGAFRSLGAVQSSRDLGDTADTRSPEPIECVDSDLADE